MQSYVYVVPQQVPHEPTFFESWGLYITISLSVALVITVIVAIFSTGRRRALKPGNCECGHIRCCHDSGTGKCTVQYPPCSDHPDKWMRCACTIFIRGNDSGGGDDDQEVDPIPSASDLEKLYGK